MKKTILSSILLMVFAVSFAQPKITIVQTSIPSTSQTFYSATATYTTSPSNGTVLSGMIGNPSSEGDGQNKIDVPGSIKDIYTNSNGQTFITCIGGVLCFSYNAVTNYPSVRLVLINSATTTAVVCKTATNGIVGSNVQVTLNSVLESGAMTTDKFTSVTSAFPDQGQMNGIVSSVSQIGNKWVIQCTPGPGWCLRWASKLPQGYTVFNY